MRGTMSAMSHRMDLAKAYNAEDSSGGYDASATSTPSCLCEHSDTTVGPHETMDRDAGAATTVRLSHQPRLAQSLLNTNTVANRQPSGHDVTWGQPQYLQGLASEVHQFALRRLWQWWWRRCFHSR